MSTDGSVIVFASYASNLVPDDTNAEFDIYVHDRQSGQAGDADGDGIADAVDSDAGTASSVSPGGSRSYVVVYPFAGFFSPVDNLPTLNAAKAGSAIPVKFSLGGNQGLAILAVGYPKSQKIGCGSSAPLDTVEETVTAGSSSLSYAAGAGQYHYVWKTDKAWAGTCRQLIVKLIDATVHVANFKLK
ncbi:MAG: PxKF domain-containing protein [Proteobacteria bacterium]|nr:PxKF domain-containing protein [Pseudomonadota bacterium]